MGRLKKENVPWLECLRYEPDTGHFYWIIKPTKKMPKGCRAGTEMIRGHISITLRGVHIIAHRLAWYFFYGRWPEEQIDHINGDPTDNRIENLRIASQQLNCMNRSGVKRQRGTPYKGVCWHKAAGRWFAQISAHKIHYYLGLFDDDKDAAIAYDEAAKKHHGEFARLNFPERKTV